MNPISEVYLDDCMNRLFDLKTKSIDVAIVDIQYNVGADKPSQKPNLVKQKNGSVLKIKSKKYTPKNWDEEPMPPEYFEQLFRVSKNQIIFGGFYYPQCFGGALVWDKLNGNSDQFGVEIAYQSFNRRNDIVYYLWQGMIQGQTASKNVKEALYQIGDKSQNEQKIHECQKPVRLYAWILENYCKGAKTILDTHMGSQSLRIAAYKMGFDFLGFEKDKEHYYNGNQRFIEQTTLPLFDNFSL